MITRRSRPLLSTSTWTRLQVCDALAPEGAIAAEISLHVINSDKANGKPFQAFLSDIQFGLHDPSCLRTDGCE